MFLRTLILCMFLFPLATAAQQAHGVFNSDRGRWLTRDPLVFVESANAFTYVLDTPLALNDPSGLVSCSAAITGACWSHPYWGNLLQAAKNSAEQACGGPVTYSCTTENCEIPAGGLTNVTCFPTPSQQIKVCKNNPHSLDSPEGFCGVLLHEFVHARQNCEAGLYTGSCMDIVNHDVLDCMLLEMEAYRTAGQCWDDNSCCKRACGSCIAYWNKNNLGGKIGCHDYCDCVHPVQVSE